MSNKPIVNIKNPYNVLVPEGVIQVGCRVVGNVMNHPNFPLGTEVLTSEVICTGSQGDHFIFETLNTIYLVV